MNASQYSGESNFESTTSTYPEMLARHHNLLTTNEPPMGLELPYIRSVVSNTGARLECLENNISQRQDPLAQSVEEHTSLSSYYSQNLAILSPLRRMPPEVLCEIFSWTLPSISQALEHERLDVKYSPWVLTHVSSRWRAVAVSTRSLWSQIVIHYSHDRDSTCVQDQFAYPLAMVETHIQRAHNLKVHFYGCTNRATGPQIEMFRCLAEHSSRWEEFSVELTPDLCPLLPPLADRLQSLRRVWIQWHGPDIESGVEGIYCFQKAPRLVDFGINNEYARPISILLPAHQLTRYHIEGPWSMHQSILPMAPNLTGVRIELDPTEESWVAHGDVINLFHLRRLFVSHTEILNCLRAPALTDMAFYHAEDESDPNPLLHLEPFVGRSNCTIRSLSIKGLPTTQITAEILQKYSSITELAIIFHIHDDDAPETDTPCNGGNTLISSLTIRNPSESAPLSPHLSEISFGCEDTYIDYSLYLEMLESRWESADCALKSAGLLTGSFVPGPDPATLEGLRGLRRDGLELLVVKGKEAQDIMDDYTYSMWC
ncbi:hypothetical protein B0H17DRAFT_547368 [Mycena rosella]|uniref:F-box domain-containing protein n=1 Tax=Mycena rosella TaxID=1033263 RepID=A0AAD7GKH2_MYCRO|nr:hypothetical protein B0H17DRAFT_547368 [Mycena rosella]